MKNIFILFSSWNNSGDTSVRKTEGLFLSLKDAQAACLELVSKIIESEPRCNLGAGGVLFDKEKKGPDGGVVISAEPDFRSVVLTDGLMMPEWRMEYEIEEHPVTGMVPKWDIVYDEEYPDSNGYNCHGFLTNGEPWHILFFSIFRDDNELIEHCSIRSNMYPLEGTELCRFPWTSENQSLLLECLDGCGDNFGCDDSPLYSLQFHEPEEDDLPKYIDATIAYKDTPGELHKVLFKLNTTVGEDDNKVFFYCEDFNGFLGLTKDDNGEDFTILSWTPVFSC